MPVMLRRSLLFWLLVVCLPVSAAQAQDGIQVLVIANEAAPDSVQIAERYVSARKIPASQLLRLNTAFTPEIARAAFEREIERPIAAWLSAHRAQDRILFLVLTRGLPLRIAGTAGRQGTTASVDSELALLYRRLTGAVVAPNGPVANPYFLGTRSVDAARRFSHAEADIYLVTRLDGFTASDAMALVDRSLHAGSSGKFVLDAVPGTADVRFTWLARAAEALAAGGREDRVVHETTARPVRGETGVLGYASWGSNDPHLPGRHPDVAFAPGGVASLFLSSDARTFAEPPADWKPGPGTGARYAGSNQALVGDLIRLGATGVSGSVAEPYLDGTVRPDILLPAYAAGFTLAEAFYLATPFLSWQTIIVGDPLCRPFDGRAPLAGAEADPPLDPETELPAHFAARRLAALGVASKNPVLLKLLLRAESRLSGGNLRGAIDSLEAATFTDASSVDAWRALAMAEEQAGAYRRAAEAYRRVLALRKDDVIALNNLAYIVGVRENRPKEALPLATRASALAKANPIIDDTLAWLHYLLGNTEEALRLLSKASRIQPTTAEIQLHAAIVYAAAGYLSEASGALKVATQLDGTLAERSDIRELQARITSGMPAAR
jgi:uncharacterized protein (TIGR03790 family)